MLYLKWRKPTLSDQYFFLLFFCKLPRPNLLSLLPQLFRFETQELFLLKKKVGVLHFLQNLQFDFIFVRPESFQIRNASGGCFHEASLFLMKPFVEIIHFLVEFVVLLLVNLKRSLLRKNILVSRNALNLIFEVCAVE